MLLQFNYRTPHDLFQSVYMVLNDGKLTPLPLPPTQPLSKEPGNKPLWASRFCVAACPQVVR